LTAPVAVPQLLLEGQVAAPEGPVDLAPMYVMHRAFRRDLDAFVAVVATIPVGDARRWARVARRFALFANVVHKHHHGEDTAVWPLLVERGADPSVVATLAAEHAEVAEIVSSIERDLQSLAEGSADPSAQARLTRSTEQLRDVLGGHLAHEERDGMVLVQEHLTQGDWTRLDEEVFSKDYGAREVPAVLGWVWSGLPEDAARRIPGADSAAFRAFARAAGWWFDQREPRIFGSQGSSRSDRVLTQVTKTVGAAHVRVLRASGGRIGARWMGGDVLVLSHTGRRSGEQRTTPVLFVRDGADVVAAASNGGIDREPQWWLNLQADPKGIVTIGGQSTPVVATAVAPEDRQRLWDALMANCGDYDTYQASVSREIALVRFTPDGSG
jgi:deazaflavin-dependent oxidoreductase (nitroreductase family)